MKYDDGTSCLSGGDPCPNPRADSRRFCESCCVALDRVKAAMGKRDPIRKAGAAPKSRPPVCRIVNCVKPVHEASTDGRSCWGHRTTLPGTTEIENGCTEPGCTRAARSTANRRCRAHSAVAVAA